MKRMIESESLEFKQEYVEDIKKEVVAFANASGGTILVGVQKDGTVIGVEDPDDVMLRLAGSLKDSIAPDIMPFVTINSIEIEEKRVIEVSIATGTNRPYYLRNKGLKPSGVYIRKGSSSQPMTDEGIRELIRQTGGMAFEEARSLNQNLTFRIFEAELERRGLEFDMQKLRTMKLIGEDGLYTNLGYMLSDQFEGTMKVALFQGTDKAVFRDRQEFSGSLLKQLEEVYNYIDIQNKTKATFSGLNRIDKRDYPEEALRESLLNAIVHRDYSFSGSNLVNIYDDRIEIVSIGGLINGLVLDSIFLGVSMPRNPNLAQVFFRLRLIESYGTGIGKIKRSYAGMRKEAVFETAPGVFRVTLPNRNEMWKDLSDTHHSQTYGDGVSSSDTEKKLVMEYVNQHGQITRKQTEELLNSGSTKAYRLLKEMCEEQKIVQAGSGRTSRYIIVTEHNI